jgi:hypothetical protein
MIIFSFDVKYPLPLIKRYTKPSKKKQKLSMHCNVGINEIYVFICGLFNDAVSSSDNNVDVFERMWEEAVVA